MATWVSEHSMQNNNRSAGNCFYEQILLIHRQLVKLANIYWHADASVELYLRMHADVCGGSEWTEASSPKKFL